MNNFQTPEIQVVLSSFFRDGNDIARGGNRGGGWSVLNIGPQNGIRRQLKARGALLDLTCAHSSPTDIGQPLMACPALRPPIQEGHDQLMAP